MKTIGRKDYTEKEIECMKKFGFNLAPGKEFQVGVHCPGSAPLKMSDGCYATCYGIKGMMTTTCVHQVPCEKYGVKRRLLRNFWDKKFEESMLKSIAEI